MRFQIVSIADRGKPYLERLHLRVLVDSELAYLIVFATHYAAGLPNQVLSGTGAAYWFPTKQVKAGDSIVLYSGPGVNTETKSQDGSTNHFFHWGMPNTLWHKPESTIVVFEAFEWQTAARPGPAPAT
jgi:hypothetical protein